MNERIRSLINVDKLCFDRYVIAAVSIDVINEKCLPKETDRTENGVICSTYYAFVQCEEKKRSHENPFLLYIVDKLNETGYDEVLFFL